MERRSEQEPDTENVVYLDEYPELRKQVWLRRLHAQRHLGVISIGGEPADVISFPKNPDDTPDGAA